MKVMVESGAEKGEKYLRDLKQKGNYRFREVDYNVSGYRLMNIKKMPEAIRMFQLGIQHYPKAANLYDSLGEAYLNNQEWDKATQQYQKALEINRLSSSPSEDLEKKR